MGKRVVWSKKKQKGSNLADEDRNEVLDQSTGCLIGLSMAALGVGFVSVLLCEG